MTWRDASRQERAPSLAWRESRASVDVAVGAGKLPPVEQGSV